MKMYKEKKCKVYLAYELYVSDQKCENALRLKVHKIENFFDSVFGICVFSLLVMSKY
jgi:hypothetical protein